MVAAALSVIFIASAVLPFHCMLAASPERPIVELANPKGNYYGCEINIPEDMMISKGKKKRAGCFFFFLHLSLFGGSPFFPIHSGENADVVIADL